MKELVIRQANHLSDLPGLKDLFNRIFTTGYWQGDFYAYHDWINASPAGPGLFVVAADGERIVGSLSFVMEPVKGHGCTFIRAQAGSAMTDPDYRRMGIYSKLSHFGFELLKQRGVDFVFGYTHDPAVLRTEIKIGYKLLGPSNVHVCPLFPVSIAMSKILKPAKPNNPLFLEKLLIKGALRLFRRLGNSDVALTSGRIQTLQQGDLDFFDTFTDKNQYSTNIDVNYLKWKFKDSEFQYTIARLKNIPVGIVVYKNKDVRRIKGVFVYEWIIAPQHRREVSLALFGDLATKTLENKRLAIFSIGDVNLIDCNCLLDMCILKTSYCYNAILYPLHENLPRGIFDNEKWRHSYGSMDYL